MARARTLELFFQGRRFSNKLILALLSSRNSQGQSMLAWLQFHQSHQLLFLMDFGSYAIEISHSDLFLNYLFCAQLEPAKTVVASRRQSSSASTSGLKKEKRFR